MGKTVGSFVFAKNSFATVLIIKLWAEIEPKKLAAVVLKTSATPPKSPRTSRKP